MKKRTLTIDFVYMIIQKYLSDVDDGRKSCTSLDLYKPNHNTTLYRDFAEGAGRAPLACCLEIFEACKENVWTIGIFQH
jgi:hypothetical protein